MDTGTEHAPTSSYLAHFEISNNFAWRGSRPQEIEQRRALLDDLLIFDILLKSGGIRSPDMLYPPHDEHSLIRLIEAIENSNYDALKKDCLIYFLLKWHQDGREERFAIQQCIPPQFAALADAYWHLDSGINLAHGVSTLADARLNRDYASKILHAISLSPDASILIRKYVRTAKPPLTEPDDIELFTLALAESSLLEAWKFQRTFHESNEIRPRLLQRILEWCVSPKPRPAALMQLLGLPLSGFEESTLHSYVLKPPSTLPLDAIPLLQDLVCVRLIQLGRYIESIRMDREFSSSKVGVNARQAQERSKMVQDLYNALPAIERTYVDTELAAEPMPHVSSARHQKSSGQKSPSGEDVDMAQSWEEIRSSELQAPTSKLPMSRPISERAGAPRFGGPAPSLPTLPTIPTPQQLGTSSANVPSSRQSFPPLPTSFGTPSGSRPRTSLSNTSGRMVLGTLPHVSSPLTGAKFPPPSLNQQQKSAGNLFVSANQQPNAFYTPPAKANGHAQPPFPPRPRTSANASVEKPSLPEKEKADDVVMEEEGGDGSEMDHQPVEGTEPEPKPAEQRQELGFSVFDNGLSNWTSIEKKFDAPDPKNKTLPKSTTSTSVKRKVPGSFGDDDEDEDMEEPHAKDGHTDKKSDQVHSEAEEGDLEHIRARTTRSRQSTTSASRKKPRSSKRNESRDSPNRRSRRRAASPQQNLPGALVNEDDHDDEDGGEEEDHVAPLRSTKSRKPGAANTASVKPISRGSTTSDLADELGEGVQTRRRSSRRITGTGSGSGSGHLASGDGDGDASPRKSTRARKPTAKAARGKKRST